MSKEEEFESYEERNKGITIPDPYFNLFRRPRFP